MSAGLALYVGRSLSRQAVEPRPAATCACGIAYTAAEFARLPQKGIQQVEDDADLLLANCACGSTIAMPLPAVQPLSVLDLLRGVRSIELRIVEKRFEAREGEPDALHVIMSSGVAFCVLHTIGGTYGVEFEGDLLETLAAEERITGLGRAQLNALGEEAARKFGDDMSVVIR